MARQKTDITWTRDGFPPFELNSFPEVEQITRIAVTIAMRKKRKQTLK